MSSPPIIGRVVHYRSYGTPGGEYTPECRTALVTEVGAWIEVGVSHEGRRADGNQWRTVEQTFHEDAVALTVLNPTGTFLNQAIPHDESREKGGTWHWPCTPRTPE